MSTATATQEPNGKLSSENPLRRRMNLLHRAHSLTNIGSTAAHSKILPGLSNVHAGGRDGERKGSGRRYSEDRSEDLSPLEYESVSESSEEDHGLNPGFEAEKRTKTVNESPITPNATSTPKRSASTKKHSAGKTERARAPPARPTVDTSFSRSPWSNFASGRSPMSPNSQSWYEFDLAVVVALVSPVGNWLTGGDHIKNLLLVVLLIFYLHQIIEIPWALYQKARPRRRSPQFPPDLSAPADARYSHLAAAELRRLELFFLLCTLLSPLIGALLLRYATEAVLGPQAVSWFSTGLFILATGMRPWAHLIDRLNERTVELQDFIHYPEMSSTSAQEKVDVAVTEELEKRIAKLEKSLAKFKLNVVHSTEEVYEYLDDAMDSVEQDLRKQEERVEEKMGQVERSLQQRPTISHILPIEWLKDTVSYTRIHRLIPFKNRWLLKSSAASPRRHKPLAMTPANSRSPRSGTPLETINEEEIMYASYPRIMRLAMFASRMVSRMLTFVFLPFSAVLRMVMGEN
ncbi:hypothetical protein DFP72DRAFT_912143 [Ephemerocybe angulata]|uniref:Uncharacterized protein n=1 Tax=Ephemerocybe angulata TaxID=980116 RepID=A0A8H6HNY0_9AGAR|nr:hypothetical protein DFP72DRAFT_912143 [Tulosesus angulatus]